MLKSVPLGLSAVIQEVFAAFLERIDATDVASIVISMYSTQPLVSQVYCTLNDNGSNVTGLLASPFKPE